MTENANPNVNADVNTNEPKSTDQKDVRMWNMLCHLTALSGYVGIPLGHILGPLLVWQLKKEEYPSVIAHGKEALNFQISATIYAIAICLPIITFPLVFVIVLVALIFTVIASIKANNGEDYKYPLTLRLIK